MTFSNSVEDDELSQLLAAWGARQRLTHEIAADIHSTVLAARESEAESAFDLDWFWSLLQPVTALLDLDKTPSLLVV